MSVQIIKLKYFKCKKDTGLIELLNRCLRKIYICSHIPNKDLWHNTNKKPQIFDQVKKAKVTEVHTLQ